jgi:hypothetical protein
MCSISCRICYIFEDFEPAGHFLVLKVLNSKSSAMSFTNPYPVHLRTCLDFISLSSGSLDILDYMLRLISFYCYA